MIVIVVAVLETSATTVSKAANWYLALQPVSFDSRPPYEF